MPERYAALLLVGAGGFVGATARFLVALVLPFIGTGFPFGTLAVNLAGCFLIGFISQLSVSSSLVSPELRLLLATGFCGGFTTFSSYMYEIMSLLRDGEIFYSTLYLLGSIVGGILCLYFGMQLAKLWA
ncbi:MAG: fluoride efflux transporter CrcB [Chlorobium phaeobacteroides]|uniref:Fluoride-specific ion channel FluC n=1 Tax=Chlorobium phaeobacteroides (strain BS1) TaxID=331678 RepID=FLUC_CHLPB|nr:RecName: Full=Fluoride-specific ion channel FluC [Chlorobium phaeobacteroides BS1]MBC8524910.1 fluoride efflux transporter CrcB [Chlorobium phaeobacteroides]MBL6956580.1 fluoride efflux transporter CrcB [Chlorobium phaeobacteroides]